MTHTVFSKKTIKFAGAMAITLASVFAITAPANAGGQISVSFNANGGEQAQQIKTGLAIYSLIQGIQSQGGIKQNGHGNNAGVAQNGSGNQGIVHQDGDGHNGSIKQNGNNNSHGLFQFGKNSNGHVNQSGNGNAGATFVFGW